MTDLSSSDLRKIEMGRTVQERIEPGRSVVGPFAGFRVIHGDVKLGDRTRSDVYQSGDVLTKGTVHLNAGLVSLHNDSTSSGVLIGFRLP